MAMDSDDLCEHEGPAGRAEPGPRGAGAIHLEEVACSECALGRASGTDRAQFCPFIIRRHAPGEILCRAGDPAAYVWFVKDGVVGLDRSPDHPEDVNELRLPGSYVGLECLMGGVYLRTARALSRAILCGATRAGLEQWLQGGDDRIAVIARAVFDEPILTEHAAGIAAELERMADG
jgi:CRP-like cAMP-binding protein